MTPLFVKLNHRGQDPILVLDAPPGFEAQLAPLAGVQVRIDPAEASGIEWMLAFVQRLDEVARVAAEVLPRLAEGDATVWLAYPKGTSKRFRCEFNRDTGWSAVGDAGWEPVRQVAIDEDWSALRFRRTRYIKTLRRDASRALSPEGKARRAV